MFLSWVKVKNPNYSQTTGRRELFEARRDRRQLRRRDWKAPVLSPDVLRASVDIAAALDAVMPLLLATGPR